jgi:hypothetical protein
MGRPESCQDVRESDIVETRSARVNNLELAQFVH